MAPPRGHMFNIGLYSEKHEKIFLSETVWPIVLLFCIYHNLVDLNQGFSNYAPLGQTWPHPMDKC